MVDYVDSLFRFMESTIVKKDAKMKMVTEWQKTDFRYSSLTYYLYKT